MPIGFLSFWNNYRNEMIDTEFFKQEHAVNLLAEPLGFDTFFCVEHHFNACIEIGLGVSGINAEVMPGQWEFQIGPLGPLEVADQLTVARWLLCRIAEHYDCDATFEPKPAKGDWNGAGCHTNFSTKEMRENWDAIIAACDALGANAAEHVKHYGHGIEDRLTGHHETQRWDTFSYGESDRGASIRIPWQVAKDRKGYIEDRRPNANCDPYQVARLLVGTRRECTQIDTGHLRELDLDVEVPGSPLSAVQNS